MPDSEQKKEPYHVVTKYNDVCRNCKGTGKRDGDHCQTCNGYGVVKITKDILIYVEPINH